MRKIAYFSQKAIMSFTDRQIIESYEGLFEGLSSLNKIELIESLSRSLKSDLKEKDATFFNSFGAFPGNRTAEEIIEDIKASRKFSDKDITL